MTRRQKKIIDDENSQLETNETTTPKEKSNKNSVILTEEVTRLEVFTPDNIRKFEKFILNREASLGKSSKLSIEDRNKFIGEEMKRVLKRIFSQEEGLRTLVNNNVNNYLLLSNDSFFLFLKSRVSNLTQLNFSQQLRTIKFKYNPTVNSIDNLQLEVEKIIQWVVISKI